MDNNTRVIIVQESKENPKGYIEVPCCGECPCIYRSHISNSKECALNGNNNIDFDEDHEIHPLCDLPLLSQVIKHSPSEKPENNKKIAITVIGRYEKDKGFCISSFPNGVEYSFQRDYKIVSWQELSK